jgi:1,2-phenylacetyl-CoA epoxidase catalytic subunit
MQPPTDARTFVADLVAEIHALFGRLGDQDTLEAQADGRLEVVALLKMALKSELEAAEIAAHWLPSTPEIDAKTVFAEQCHDELKHYNLIVARLEELGEDLAGFDAFADGHSPLFRYLRGLRTTVERIAAGPFACEAVAEVRNRQFIDLCRRLGDIRTAELYERVIHPEEIHHHHRGRQILERYATTPDLQALVRDATLNSLAIADELKTLAGQTTGLPSAPLS